MSAYAVSLALHIAAGTAALATFWTAAVLRKGSPAHVLTGRVYLGAMVLVVATGAPLAWALIGRGHPLTALFLAYLLVLVANGCWAAWRAIRDRRHPQRYFGLSYWLLAAIVFVSGAAVAWLGVREGHVLLMVFGGIGVFAGIESTFGPRRARGNPRWWMREHYAAMVGNGVATHIAFFGIGLRSLLPGVDPYVLTLLSWGLPLAGAIVAAAWLRRRYGRSAARVADAGLHPRVLQATR